MSTRRAFTMIELLVAMAVLAVLVVMLLGLVDSTSKLWRANESRVDAYREARAALSVMARDLGSASAGKKMDFFRVNDQAYPFLSDALKNTNNAGALFFLTTLPSSAQQPEANRSALCQVGYFLAYGDTSMSPGAQNERSLNLYRYFQSSDASLPLLTNSVPPYFPLELGPRNPNVELLARNISGFRVLALDADGNSYVQTVDSPMPPVIRIEITALNQETAKKLKSIDQWTNTTGDLSAVVNQNKQTFYFRTGLKNKP